MCEPATSCCPWQSAQDSTARARSTGFERGCGVNRLLPLARAVRLHVEPGMHLHFASTPSRSNAAVREVARAFLDRRPGFVLSSTGFHSSAHTLALLGLGRRYLSCFFGDNYPTPRPNALYRTLAKEDALEHWSLLTYVLALRAAALGHPY